MRDFYNCGCSSCNSYGTCGSYEHNPAYKTCGPCNPFNSQASHGLFKVHEHCNAYGCCGAGRRCTSIGTCGFPRSAAPYGDDCGKCNAPSCRPCGSCSQFGCSIGCNYGPCSPCNAGKTCSSFGSCGCCCPCKHCGPCGGTRCGANGPCFSNLPCGSFDRRMPGGTCKPCESCKPCKTCDPCELRNPFGSGKPFDPANLRATGVPFEHCNLSNLRSPSATFSSCGPCGPCDSCRPCTPWAPCGSCAPPSCCSLPRRTCRVPNYTQLYLAAVRRCYSSTGKKVRVKKAKTSKKVTSKSAVSNGRLAICE